MYESAQRLHEIIEDLEDKASVSCRNGLTAPASAFLSIFNGFLVNSNADLNVFRFLRTGSISSRDGWFSSSSRRLFNVFTGDVGIVMTVSTTDRTRFEYVLRFSVYIGEINTVVVTSRA